MKKKYTEVSKKEWEKLVKEKDRKRTCAFQTWCFTELYGLGDMGEKPQCMLVSSDVEGIIHSCHKEICPFWRG